MTEQLLPSPEVAAELREALSEDTSRLGETYRGLERGLTHREIADELGVPTHAFGYNNQMAIEAILEGRRSSGAVLTRTIRGRASSLLQKANLTPEAKDYLTALIAELDAGPASTHDWDSYVAWAQALGEVTDLEHEEHAYKRDVAARLSTVREEALTGAPDWVDDLRKRSANLLDRFFLIELANLVRDHGEEFEGAVLSFWTGEPDIARLDELSSQLKLLQPKLTPGDRTAFGSLLLLAQDPDRFPPYRPTPVERSHKLSGVPMISTSEPAARYEHFLEWLDAFIAAAGERGLDIPSRLEAQGYAWALAKYDPAKTPWDEEKQAEFRSWRGDPEEPQRAWLVRAKVATVADWVEQDYVSLAATYLGEVAPGAELKVVKAAVEEGYQHQDYGTRKALAEEYHAFLTQMRVGDVVVTQADDWVRVGVVGSSAHYTEGGGDRLRRVVSWIRSVKASDLVPPLPSLLDLQGSVVDITEGLPALLDLLGEDGGDDEDTVNPPPPPEVVPGLPAVTGELASRLHMAASDLQEIVDLLASRQQIVLYGPPGTGKTYLALALARHVVGPGDRSRVQLVQFHPSFAYEDFFEGYRPIETEQGQPSFELQPGPLRRIANEARENPGTPFVLVIDELNRANLAKVFGELYFLLEYRNESIQLQYQPTKAFRLPPNLFFIGTMNTADRSIALLDAAMRRRFSFVELHPDSPPVRDVLAAWLQANHQDGERAQLLAALNEAIDEQDRDMRIGPSYLMRGEAATEAGLQRIWKHDIMPLLEEHYYGRMSRDQVHNKFGLDALRSGLAPEVAANQADDELADDELIE